MNKRRLLADGATGVLVLCAVVVSAATVRREFFSDRRTSTLPFVSVEKEWSLYAKAGHVLGQDDAPVTIVEFSDFQCGFCAKFALYMDSLRALGINVRVIYRHFPLQTHTFAIPAIRASECAAEEGKFTSMHALLFNHADSLGIASWWWFAKAAGLQDSVRFHKCLARTGPIPALVRDSAAARQLGIRGTPTLLIHDLRLNGLPGFDSLRAYISRAKAKPTGGR
jgi:protein-disulfide isomerase